MNFSLFQQARLDGILIVQLHILIMHCKCCDTKTLASKTQEPWKTAVCAMGERMPSLSLFQELGKASYRPPVLLLTEMVCAPFEEQTRVQHEVHSLDLTCTDIIIRCWGSWALGKQLWDVRQSAPALWGQSLLLKLSYSFLSRLEPLIQSLRVCLRMYV